MMGKKVISDHQQASAKASKNHEKQLHSLIKVLKPKVYITDSSSFKQLVQELTGYQKLTQISAAPVFERADQDKVPVIEIEDQLEGQPPISMDSSFSSFELLSDNNIDQAFQLEEIYQVTGPIHTADHEMISTFEDDQVRSLSTYQQQTNWLAYQNLESWLLDAADEPYSYCNYSTGGLSTQNYEQDHHHHHHHQASLFDDYELSGLI